MKQVLFISAEGITDITANITPCKHRNQLCTDTVRGGGPKFEDVQLNASITVCLDCRSILAADAGDDLDNGLDRCGACLTDRHSRPHWQE